MSLRAAPPATPDRGSKNIFVLAIVVPELEFGHVQRQILGADFVICAHNAALNQRPESFDGLRVDRAAHILIAFVIDYAKREFLEQRCTRYGRRRTRD